mgnify:CR=1 FL=1
MGKTMKGKICKDFNENHYCPSTPVAEISYLKTNYKDIKEWNSYDNY